MIKNILYKFFRQFYSLEFKKNIYVIFKKKHTPIYDYFSWGRDNRILVDNSEDIQINKAKLVNYINQNKHRDWGSLMSNRGFLLRKSLVAINLLSFLFIQFVYSYGFLTGLKKYISFIIYKYSSSLEQIFLKILSNNIPFKKILLYLYFIKFNYSFILLSDKP